MVGGWYGASQYLSASSKTISAVMVGRAYSSWGGQIHCYDVRTGEELWAVDGSFSFARLRYATGTNYPELIYNSLTGAFRKYNGITGALIHESTHPRFSGGFFGSSIFVDPYFYSLQTLENITYLVKWDTTSNSANFASRVVWNVTFYDRNTGEGIKITEYSWGRGGANVMNVGDYRTIAFVTYPIYGESGAFDTTTGQLLWHRNIEDFESRLSIGAGYGYFYMTEWPDHWNAWDFRT
jgi:outer membrane protein assembly factor BamB